MRSPKILYTSPNLPTPTTSGGAQRTALLLKALQQIGEVDSIFLPAKLPDTASALKIQKISNCLSIESTDAIRRQRVGILGKTCTKSLQTFIKAELHKWHPHQPLIEKMPNLDDYDLVISRYLSPACMLNLFRHPRLIIDVDDYDPDRLRQRIYNSGFVKNLTLRRCLNASKQAHREKIPQAANHWVSNPVDKKHQSLDKAIHLPNIPFFKDGILPDISSPDSKSQNFLMIGTFSYSANSVGLEIFLRKAWPKVIAQYPQATLTLIGGGMSKKQQQTWSQIKGVRALGFVEGLESFYKQSVATIAPILAGGGTNIKVLESAAYCRTPILSQVAHRGFETDLISNESCLVSGTIEEMANACIQALKKPTMNTTIGMQARAIIEKKYTQKRFNEIAINTCNRIITDH